MITNDNNECYRYNNILTNGGYMTKKLTQTKRPAKRRYAPLHVVKSKKVESLSYWNYAGIVFIVLIVVLAICNN